MKRFFVLLPLLSILLTGCIAVTPGNTGTTDDPAATAETEPNFGWKKEGIQTYYIYEDGKRHTGWLDLDGKRYYLDKTGALQTGWITLDGEEYYLQSDGSILRGKATVDGNTCYFTSYGAKVVVVNPWNMVPNDYSPDLVVSEDGYKVDRSCNEALLQMLTDCRAAGYDARITSAFRKRETQIELYNNKVNYFLDQGYTPADARAEAATIIAVPGTSEHELGLAVDLVDSSHWVLDETQEDTAAQKWLMEHCWEYGFILRYPNGKTDATGIIYEPWHYRYVGKTLALELKNSGLCLEEYLAGLS